MSGRNPRNHRIKGKPRSGPISVALHPADLPECRAKQNRSLQKALYNRVLCAKETERLDSVRMADQLVWTDDEGGGSTSQRVAASEIQVDADWPEDMGGFDKCNQVQAHSSGSMAQQEEEGGDLNQEWQGPLALSVYEQGGRNDGSSTHEVNEEDGEEEGTRKEYNDVNARKVQLTVEESDSSENEEEQEERYHDTFALPCADLLCRSILRMCRLRFGGVQMLLGSDVMVGRRRQLFLPRMLTWHWRFLVPVDTPACLFTSETQRL
eukprot:763232-Hanusia_phi.AAC.4